MTSEDIFLKELQTSFLEEASELLERLESCFLILEKDSSDEQVIQEIFRIVHNIKGSAASVDFAGLSAFAHQFENLLVKLKNKEIATTPTIIDLLLKGSDTLIHYVKNLKADSKHSPNVKSLMCEFANAMNASNPEDVDAQINTQIDTSEMIEAQKAKDAVEEYKNIGEILLEENLINHTQLDDAIIKQNRRLGEILVDEGALAKNDLEKALEKQAEHNKHIGKKQEEYIRLPVSKIEGLLNNFGEQVILQSALEHYRKDLAGNSDAVNKTIMQLHKITYDLQQTAISLRMLSMKNIFAKMERIVRDSSKALSKNIRFEMEGEDLELDKAIMDEIASPLTHLIRNSVDHGIEDKDDRLMALKNPQGIIKMRAFYLGRYFCIEISDDGKGLDENKIKRKAIEKGLIAEDTILTKSEVLKLIFMSGFSTKDQVTDLSGRGVGMDAVKQVIDKLHGTLDVQSTTGVGTVMTIKLPPSLAIFNGIIATIGDEKFIVPTSELSKIVPITDGMLRRVNAQESMIEYSNEIYSVIDIAQILNRTHLVQGKSIMLTINQGTRHYGLLVDDITAIQKIVFKNLGEEINGLPGISGGSILADGSVALILDLFALVDIHSQQVKAVDQKKRTETRV